LLSQSSSGKYLINSDDSTDSNNINNTLKASSCSAAIISLQSCVRRLFLFSDEKYIPEEVILDAMGLRCNRLNNKVTRLETIIIILNLLHNKRFYFTTGN
jgi:hypothetical protein